MSMDERRKREFYFLTLLPGLSLKMEIGDDERIRPAAVWKLKI